MKTLLEKRPARTFPTTVIPFNRVRLPAKVLSLIKHVLKNGALSGDGEFTKKCQSFFEEIVGAGKAFLVPSGTHALEMAALLLSIKPGDEVIVPSFSFPSAANAFMLFGAKPVFIDSRPDTLNLDEKLLEKLITPRTRAIVAIHYAGVACEMDKILEIANRRGIPVVEDNAHGLLGSYRGQPLGTFGAFAIQSFHETKNFTCGEGGALFVNDPRYVDRAEIVREKGTNRTQFKKGRVDKYRWMDLGSSYLLSDILAACLWPQLEAWKIIQAKRKKIWRNYAKNLHDWSVENGVRLPFIPESCEPSYHLFYLLMPSEKSRERAVSFLRKNGITATFHFLPLHVSPMGQKMGGKAGDCPVAESIAARLLRLPLYPGLSSREQKKIIQTILKLNPANE